MTSTSFIKEVAQVSGLSQKAVKEMASTFESVLKDILARGESVKFADVNYSVKDIELVEILLLEKLWNFLLLRKLLLSHLQL